MPVTISQHLPIKSHQTSIFICYKNRSLGINLAGILIGDGYVDPEYQINNYDSFLYSVGVSPL